MSLIVSQLHVSRSGRLVLDSASFEVPPGNMVGLLGANGAGKSTLIAAVAGELGSLSADIRFDGVRLSQMSVVQQAQRRAVLPQSPGLSFDLGVSEVVQMGAYPFDDQVDANVMDAAQAFAMQAMSLESIADRSYLSLSGGEQQRVQLARVVVQVELARSVHETAYLLLDEPVSSLDPAFQFEWMSFLFEYTRQKQVGVLMALHDINLAARWCDSVMLLSKGCIQAQGAPSEVLTTDHLMQTYGLFMHVLPHPIQAGRLLVLSS